MIPPAKNCRIMVLTGEPSGDFHAAALIMAMQRIEPNLDISGIGGPCMQAANVDIFFPIEKLSAMGLTEVLFQFKFIKQAYERFKSELRTQRPDLIILIDYPGFNLKAAQYVKQHYAIPVLYYITPKVWAWKESRLQQIKQYVDHAVLIFPFEQKIYQRAGIPSTYVGNPLMDDYPDHLAKPFIRQGSKGSFPRLSCEETFCTNEMGCNGPVIGLLPGSRKAEISNLLAIMIETALKIHEQKKNARFLISAASPIRLQQIDQILSPHKQTGLFEVILGRPLEIFKRSDLLVAASGTVTLEAALCCLPTIIVYKMSPVSYTFAKILIRVKYAGLANLIAGRELMPEFIQEKATPEEISQKAFSMLENLTAHENQLLMVRKLLGGPGASKKTARIALDLAKFASSKKPD